MNKRELKEMLKEFREINNDEEEKVPLVRVNTLIEGKRDGNVGTVEMERSNVFDDIIEASEYTHEEVRDMLDKVLKEHFVPGSEEVTKIVTEVITKMDAEKFKKAQLKELTELRDMETTLKDILGMI